MFLSLVRKCLHNTRTTAPSASENAPIIKSRLCYLQQRAFKHQLLLFSAAARYRWGSSGGLRLFSYILKSYVSLQYHLRASESLGTKITVRQVLKIPKQNKVTLKMCLCVPFGIIQSHRVLLAVKDITVWSLVLIQFG